MTTVTGRPAPPSPSRTLQQFCKHFGHKAEATFDERPETIAFPTARATLGATDEALSVTLEAAGAEGLERVQGVELERSDIP